VPHLDILTVLLPFSQSGHHSPVQNIYHKRIRVIFYWNLASHFWTEIRFIHTSFIPLFPFLNQVFRSYQSTKKKVVQLLHVNVFVTAFPFSRFILPAHAEIKWRVRCSRARSQWVCDEIDLKVQRHLVWRRAERVVLARGADSAKLPRSKKFQLRLPHFLHLWFSAVFLHG